MLFEKIALFQELPHVAEIYLPSVWTLKFFHLNWYTTEIETDFPCVGFPHASIFLKGVNEETLGIFVVPRVGEPYDCSLGPRSPSEDRPQADVTGDFSLGLKGWEDLLRSIPGAMLKGILYFKWPLEQLPCTLCSNNKIK